MILMQSPIDSDRTYQIFKREADNTTVCIEIVKGLQKARNRIDHLQSSAPGSELSFPISNTEDG